jgi:hypothetical protein
MTKSILRSYLPQIMEQISQFVACQLEQKKMIFVIGIPITETEGDFSMNNNFISTIYKH